MWRKFDFSLSRHCSGHLWVLPSQPSVPILLYRPSNFPLGNNPSLSLSKVVWMNLSLLPTSGLTKHSILSPETHPTQRYAYEIKHQANKTRSRELCSHHWATGTAGLRPLGKQHSSVEWLVATSTTARKESLKMNLTEKNRTKRLGEDRQKRYQVVLKLCKPFDSSPARSQSYFWTYSYMSQFPSSGVSVPFNRVCQNISLQL